MTIPPPPSRANRKGTPPAADDVPGALFTPPPPPASEPKPAPKRDTPFNFRVERGVKRRFAQKALDLDVSGVELIEALIDLYLDDERLEGALRSRAER